MLAVSGQFGQLFARFDQKALQRKRRFVPGTIEATHIHARGQFRDHDAAFLDFCGSDLHAPVLRGVANARRRPLRPRHEKIEPQKDCVGPIPIAREEPPLHSMK